MPQDEYPMQGREDAHLQADLVQIRGSRSVDHCESVAALVVRSEAHLILTLHTALSSRAHNKLVPSLLDVFAFDLKRRGKGHVHAAYIFSALS
jgi:hypothetical protein